ncbi:type VII toxin-antitoxin system MntA family adenylyltransferase antitoxin [Catenovulum maritimum]|uniref:Polymerase beta nucleotidyltransferase domain-containing protein n=1 Tax=Catenovulum maritimum TaxID=1513271 RepID=A0A0J8JJU2_9ALTE|nr:nucleotidyltransferase domain-containing protein [Catenovulum maritimum]KMT64716.1 hypothetical protein XM47_12715 [Catenovulum maritimum]
MTQQTIQKIIQLASNNQEIEIVWLYGSRARNTARQHSDYDIAIAYKTFYSEKIKSTERIQEQQLNWQDELGYDIKLSLIDINQVPIYLAFSVIAEGKVIHSANEYRLIKEEQRIMNQYEFANKSAG